MRKLADFIFSCITILCIIVVFPFFIVIGMLMGPSLLYDALVPDEKILRRILKWL